jgi:hypothetical protein
MDREEDARSFRLNCYRFGSAATQVVGQGRKDGWFPFLRNQTWPLPAKEGVSMWDHLDRGLYVKGNYKSLKHGAPVWIRAVSGRPNHYELSTIKTKNGRSYEIKCAAYGLKAFGDPEIAGLFPETVRMLVKGLREAGLVTD